MNSQSLQLSVFNRMHGPLSDTLQAGCKEPFANDKLTHIASLQFLPSVNMGCALAIAFQVCSLYVPTKERLPSLSLFPGVPSL